VAPTVIAMDPTRPFPLAAPLRVDPAAIERGLEQFWQRADQAPALGGNTSVVRSCTLNFAIVLSADDAPGPTTDIIAPVTLRHPCRIFLLAAQPQLADSLQTSVSALCHLAVPGQPHICCEQITVEAQGRAVDDLAHLLLALLVPDLPLVVWWRGRPPLDTSLFAALNAIADRVVIDTLELAVQDVPRVAALLDGERPLPLADLAWSRLRPWRTLTAQAFDAPHAQACLGALDRIRVEVNGGAVTSEALLWLGWLASRLKWTPRLCEADGPRCRYTFDAEQTVHADIDCTGEGDAGLLCAIELSARSEPAIRCVVGRCAEGAVRATVDTHGSPSLERIVPLAQRDPAALLSDQFDVMGRDPLYHAALHLAGRLATLARRA
jgi:glucose-6-phosphate dehydrogenase assembly protein OpcA